MVMQLQRTHYLLCFCFIKQHKKGCTSPLILDDYELKNPNRTSLK